MQIAAASVFPCSRFSWFFSFSFPVGPFSFSFTSGLNEHILSSILTDSPASPEGQRRPAARWFPVVPEKEKSHFLTRQSCSYDITAACRSDSNAGVYSRRLLLALGPAEDSESRVKVANTEGRIRFHLTFLHLPYLTGFNLKFGPVCGRPEPNLITPEVKCED